MIEDCNRKGYYYDSLMDIFVSTKVQHELQIELLNRAVLLERSQYSSTCGYIIHWDL